MAVQIDTPIVYAVDGSDIVVQPEAFVTTRDPNTDDRGPLGAVWINESTLEKFTLLAFDGSGYNWQSDGSAGSGSFTTVTINPGDLDVTAGDTTLGGDLTISGLTTFNGDATVSSGQTFTVNGDFDLSSAQLIDLVSTLDAAPSILLHANGGTSEQIRLHSDQGTSVNSVELDSDVGGITLVSGLASDDAINLNATAGGVDIDGALQVNIASSENAADALVLSSSAGGIDITASGGAGEDIDISNSASVNISSSEAVGDSITIEASDGAGGIQMSAGTGGILMGNQADCTTIDIGDFAATANRTITIAGGQQATISTTDLVDIAPDGVASNADSIKQVDIASGNVSTGQSIVNINTGTAASGTSTVNVSTNTGGGTKAVNIGNADGLTTCNIDAICNINDDINVATQINTGTSTGTVSIGNGSAGAISLDSGAGISLDGATASNFTVSGASEDLTLSSTSGSVVITGQEDAAGAVAISTNAGTSETLTLTAAQGTGADSVDISSTAGGITLTSNLASADGINLNAVGGGLDFDSALQMNLESAQAASDAIHINASDAAGGIDVDCGTGGFALDSTGAYSLDGAANSNVSVSGAGVDLSLVSAGGRVVVQGDESEADAVRLTSSAGGLDADFADDIALDNSAGNITLNSAAGTLLLDSSGVLELNSSGGVISIGNDAVAQNINVGTGAAARTITVGNTSGASQVDVDCGTGGVNVGTSANNHEVTVGSTSGTSGVTVQAGSGGIDFSASGIMTATPATASVAGTSLTINANLGVATFTGQTTAAGDDETLTITNSVVSATSALFVSVSNVGSNDAKIALERVKPGSGSFEVFVQNKGAASLNGDILVQFWVFA